MTGIDGVNTQDFALQEGMGAIVDRSKEHVGTTDRAIILLRKVLLDVARRRWKRGGTPRGDRSGRPTAHLRAVDRTIPKGTDWSSRLRARPAAARSKRWTS